MKRFRNICHFFVLVFLSAITIVNLSGCEERFTQIDSKNLQAKWEENIKHTAVSWWYLGEKDNVHYIVEKWPTKKHGYKINKQQLDVLLAQPKDLTFDETEWINLKKHHLIFKSPAGQN